MKKILVSTFLMLFCSTFLFASGIEGKWSASIETDNGDFSFTITYNVDGENLSGIISSDMGDVTFKDGKIEGDTFKYEFYLDSYTISHEGKVLNDKEIKIKSSGDYGDSEFTIKKIEEKE